MSRSVVGGAVASKKAVGKAAPKAALKTPPKVALKAASKVTGKVTAKVTAKVTVRVAVVNYSYGTQTYQIDPERQKVYRQFVEIETGRASTIFASWRAHNL